MEKHDLYLQKIKDQLSDIYYSSTNSHILQVSFPNAWKYY